MALGEQAQWHKELDELDVSWEMESWRLRYNKKIQKILHVYMPDLWAFDSVICEAGMLFNQESSDPDSLASGRQAAEPSYNPVGLSSCFDERQTC